MVSTTHVCTQETMRIVDDIKCQVRLWIVLTGSCRYCITPSIICGKRASICLWQPSPTAEIAISAACLNNWKIYLLGFFKPSIQIKLQ